MDTDTYIKQHDYSYADALSNRERNPFRDTFTSVCTDDCNGRHSDGGDRAGGGDPAGYGQWRQLATDYLHVMLGLVLGVPFGFCLFLFYAAWRMR